MLELKYLLYSEDTFKKIRFSQKKNYWNKISLMFNQEDTMQCYQKKKIVRIKSNNNQHLVYNNINTPVISF